MKRNWKHELLFYAFCVVVIVVACYILLGVLHVDQR